MFRPLKLYGFFRGLISLAAPNRCPFCGDVIGTGDYYCGYCFERLPFAGEKIPAPENVSEMFSCCYYRGRARSAVLMLKYGRLIYPAEAFALMMSERLKGVEADILVPVPSGFKSVKKRGFSTAKLISDLLSVRLGIPVSEALCAKEGKKEQKRLSAKQRRENAELCFEPAKNADVRNKRVILIDDVSTTGSTVSAAAGILLSLGAADVKAAVFAKTLNCSHISPSGKKYRIHKNKK